MERIWLRAYPEGVPADIDPNAYRSIGDFFAASIDRYRDRTAFVSMGRTMSYRELDHRSRAFASYLLNVAGLPRGARVALMMPNLLQYPVALFGALRAGYVVVNCNPLYSPRELHHQLADSGAEAIVVLENFAQTLERAMDGTAVRTVVVTAVGDLLGGPRGLLINFVLRHVRRLVPPWKLPRAVRFNYRRDDGRAQGRDADPSQHDREPATDARLARVFDRFGKRSVCNRTAALSRLRADGELLRTGDDRGQQSPHRQSARHQGVRRGDGEDAVHRDLRRQHLVQRAAQRRRVCPA
jgi:acyl-CoA synthetase (AMP-forming)/AMP-acid ligase II